MGNIGQLLVQQSPMVRWLLAIICAVFTGIISWGFVLDIQSAHTVGEALKGIPTQLQVMWTSVVGLLAMGVDKLETALKTDLDNDGDIGGVPVSANIAPTEPVVAPVEIPDAVTAIDTVPAPVVDDGPI